MVAWLEENGVGQEKFLTASVTGSSAVNVIRVSQFQSSTGKTVLPQQSQKMSYLWYCQNLRHQAFRYRESPLANLTDWLKVVREDGVKVAVRPTPCHNGRVLAGTTSAILTRTMMRNWQTKSFSKLGCQWTSTSVVPSMQSFTCSTLASGTSSSMTSVLYRPKSPSKTL